MSLNTTESHGLLCSLLVEYPMEYFNTASTGQFTTILKGTDSTPIQCCRITSLPRCLFFKPCFTSVSIMIILLLYVSSFVVKPFKSSFGRIQITTFQDYTHGLSIPWLVCSSASCAIEKNFPWPWNHVSIHWLAMLYLAGSVIWLISSPSCAHCLAFV